MCSSTSNDCSEMDDSTHSTTESKSSPPDPLPEHWAQPTNPDTAVRSIGQWSELLKTKQNVVGVFDGVIDIAGVMEGVAVVLGEFCLRLDLCLGIKLTETEMLLEGGDGSRCTAARRGRGSW